MTVDLNKDELRWTRLSGGIESLSDEDKAYAFCAYEKWSKGLPVLPLPFSEFVSTVQDKDKAQFRDDEISYLKMRHDADVTNGDKSPEVSPYGVYGMPGVYSNYGTSYLNPNVLKSLTREPVIMPRSEEEEENSIESAFAEEAEKTAIKHRIATARGSYKKGYDVLDFDKAKQEVIIKLMNGEPLTDAGDKISYRTKKPLDIQSAQQVAELIASKGWTSVKLKGTPEFKMMVTKALLALDPPIPTNVILPDAVKKEAMRAKVKGYLDSIPCEPSQNPVPVERAKENLKTGVAWAGDVLTAMKQPVPSVDELAQPMVNERIKKGETAQKDLEAVQEHMKEFRKETGVLSRMVDMATRKQYRLIADEEGRLKRKVDFLNSTQERDIDYIFDTARMTIDARNEVARSMEPTIEQLNGLVKHQGKVSEAINSNEPAILAQFQKPVKEADIVDVLNYLYEKENYNKAKEMVEKQSEKTSDKMVA